jgi:hypothetical protein
MAYMTCMAPCINCRQIFNFNPDRVPSIRVNGNREPICLACVEAANPQRLANGLEPIRVLPGAYEPQECE